MGFQPPATQTLFLTDLPLASMACLDVEPPAVCRGRFRSGTRGFRESVYVCLCAALAAGLHKATSWPVISACLLVRPWKVHGSAVLQLRLQQRRTREQLVDQGIMPQLPAPDQDRVCSESAESVQRRLI
ncbi:hypothetical protein JZ751_006213 [Albula glossodonta]|uniref:Phosphatase and actin regulator n=1 Tax=Albula glossodonta TaxID=121402 RepID=A0A8T2N6G6_9TELE|nr:hypothetical protein JZ751_006213 [Albula glossodonta]